VFTEEYVSVIQVTGGPTTVETIVPAQVVPDHATGTPVGTIPGNELQPPGPIPLEPEELVPTEV